MATGVTVPLSEYLTTSYSPDCEWVRGEVRERLMGDRPHAATQQFFLKYFALREAELGLLVYPELRLQVSPQNFRVPDVMLIRATDPFDDIVRVAPVLCIEVLSPDDRMIDLYGKVDEYLAMGVDAVWVIDPRRRQLFSTESGELAPSEMLRLESFSVGITANEIFLKLDKAQANRG